MIRIHSQADVPRAPWYVIADRSSPKRDRMLIIPARTETEAKDMRKMEIVSKRASAAAVTTYVPPINPDKVEWSMPIEHALISDLMFPKPVRKGA